MLVLTRRAEEKIKIGDQIVVSILSIDGNVVKIGVDAPKDVAIFRMEVLEQVKNENIAAAKKDLTDIAAAAELFKKTLSREKKE